MKALMCVIFFHCFMISIAEAQSVYLSAGGGFSAMKPPSNYSFVYAIDSYRGGLLWPGKFEGILGKRPTWALTLLVGLSFDCPAYRLFLPQDFRTRSCMVSLTL